MPCMNVEGDYSAFASQKVLSYTEKGTTKSEAQCQHLSLRLGLTTVQTIITVAALWCLIYPNNHYFNEHTILAVTTVLSCH